MGRSQTAPANPARQSGRQPASVSSLPEVPKKPPKKVADRRVGAIVAQMAGSSVQVAAFSNPCPQEVVNKICEAPFLANHWDLGRSGLQLQVPEVPHVWENFSNAQAAFIALSFWQKVGDFAGVSAEEAEKMAGQMEGSEASTYAGYGSEWNGMFAVLRQKFKPGTEMANKLVQTGEAFLLYRQYHYGVDPVWSDNHDGSGLNCLGMQLMIIRDELRRKEGRWTKTIRMSLDLVTGKMYSSIAEATWREAVYTAVAAVENAELQVHGA